SSRAIAESTFCTATKTAWRSAWDVFSARRPARPTAFTSRLRKIPMRIGFRLANATLLFTTSIIHDAFFAAPAWKRAPRMPSRTGTNSNWRPSTSIRWCTAKSSYSKKISFLRLQQSRSSSDQYSPALDARLFLRPRHPRIQTPPRLRSSAMDRKLQHQSVTGAKEFAFFGRGDAGVGGQAG